MSKISEGLKNPLTKEDIFSDKIKLAHLKRVDKLFNKGIDFYLNPKIIDINDYSSIFFRKDKFNLDLNIGAKIIVHEFENLKTQLDALSKLSDFNTKRILPVFSIDDSPKLVAEEVRKSLYPDKPSSRLRDFLKQLIFKLSDKNIYVFEFIEVWNKKETANINGLFINPNLIVLKRQQKSLRREIFTLCHELGHYLINEEEIEDVDELLINKNKLSRTEQWCNKFAYNFLIDKYRDVVENIEIADESNDYHTDLINEISKKTHLSVLSLYTKLLYDKKISKRSYKNIKNDILDYIKQQDISSKKQYELMKLSGKKINGSTPKPINSPLFIDTLQSALTAGVINEYDFCKKLNIKPENIDQFI